MSREKYKKSDKYLFSCISGKNNIEGEIYRPPEHGGRKDENNEEGSTDFNHIKQVK